MKLVDKKCLKCGKVYGDLLDGDLDKCDCGEELLRLYTTPGIELFKPGFYENFEAEPIYIETKKQFQNELDKRGLVRVH